MKLYYCDTCGLRIPANEIPPDQPEPEDGKYYCAQHHPAPVLAKPSKSPSASVLPVPLPNAGSAQSRTKIPSGTRASIPRMTPAHQPAAHQTPTHPPGKAAGNKNVIIFGSAGAVFVVLVAVIALSGNSKPTHSRETPQTDAPVAGDLHPPTTTALANATTTTLEKPPRPELPPGPGFLTPDGQSTEHPISSTGAGKGPGASDVVVADPLSEKSPLSKTPITTPAVPPPVAPAATTEALVPAPPPNPLNLLKDPGFESGSATLWLPYNDAKVIEDPAKAHSGKFCARLRFNNEPTMRQVVTGLTPGGHYIASAWIKGTHGSLGVKEFSSATVETVKFATRSDEYQLISIPFTMGPNYSSVKVFFRCTWSKEDTFYDDVMLVADTPSPDVTTPAKPLTDKPDKPSGTTGTTGTTTEVKPTELSIAQKMEAVRENTYTLLQQNKADAALAALAEAKADPLFSAQSTDLDSATVLARSYDATVNAEADGLKKLSDGRAFVFKKKAGRDIPIGGATKASVSEFKDGEIVIETKDGGMVATQKILLDELTLQCRLDLSALAQPSGAESEMKLAFAEFMLLRAGRGGSVAGIRTRLERAKKDSSVAPILDFMLRELEALAVNQRIDGVTQKIDALIQAGNQSQVWPIYNSLKKEFGATPPLHLKKFMDEHMNLELEPGLWASYFSGPAGKEFEKYHLSRVEPRVVIDWGLKSPDPSVPVDYFTGKLCGMLRVEKAGNYTFMSKTDDHIDFAVDGHRVLVNDSNAYVEGKLTLTAGDHPIRIYFREDGGGACLSLKWKLEGAFDTQEIPASALWHEPQMKEQYQKPGK